MDDMVVKKINNNDDIPYDLLLLADPSIEIINDYVSRSSCYGAYIKKSIVGVCVMIKTRPLTLEIVNIAVDQNYQDKGIGKRLLLTVIDIAKSEKAKLLEIGTGNSSIYQLALY